jgi:hypothetical protein
MLTELNCDKKSKTLIFPEGVGNADFMLKESHEYEVYLS